MKIKKILATTLSVVALSNLPLIANAQDMTQVKDVVFEEEGEMKFSDVSPNHWSYKAVKKVVEEYGVLGGFPDGTFKGSRNLTRYEAAAIVMKLVEYMEQSSAKGTQASSNNKVIVDKLKKEFMSEIDTIKADMKKAEAKHEELQQSIDKVAGDVDVVKSMLPKVKVNGEATVRYQVVTREMAPDKFLVNTPQMRARLGFVGKNDFGMKMGIGVVTGAANDLTNRFVSIGNSNQNLGISLDQMYVGIRPQVGPVNIDLTLGKHINKFVRTTELVFDNDLTFDGGYLKLQFGDDDNNLSLLGAGSMFLSDFTVSPAIYGEQGGNFLKNNAGAFGGGLSLNLANDTVKLMVGGNYYSLMNPNRLANASITMNNGLMNLKSVDAEKKVTGYMSKFDLATGSLLFTLFPKAYFPITIKGDLSYNLGYGKNADDATKDLYKSQMPGMGFIAGVELGKLQEAGNIMIGYNYKSIGVDSVYTPLMEDQIGMFGVNGATSTDVSALAHEVKLGVQVAPSTSIILSGQLSNPLGQKENADKALGLITARAYVKHAF